MQKSHRKVATPRKKMIKILDDLFSEVVQKQWGHKCAWPGCSQPGNQPHHFFHKAQGNAARYNLNNGVLLCFAHHIRQVHQKGDTEPIRDVLIAKIGQEEFERLKQDVKRLWKPTIRELETLAMALKIKKEVGE